MWGRGRWGEKKSSELCVWGEGEEGGVSRVKEERLGSCVYVGGRGRWGE